MSARRNRENAATPWIAGLLIAGLVLVTPLAAADETAAGPEAPKATPATAAPSASGLVIYVDPETGELTGEPTPGQAEVLSRMRKATLDRSSDGLETFELSSGGRGVHLGGRFHTARVVRWLPATGFELMCADRPQDAAAARRVSTSAPPESSQPVWEER